jgi:hypothetical protein
MIPEDLRKARMGEDAAEASDRFLVVSDGAGHGEWERQGIDSGFFSRHLAKGMYDHYARLPGADPYYLLFEGVLNSKEAYMGSATVTAITIESPNRLRTISIGDSGYALFHVDPKTAKVKLYFRSKEQFHPEGFDYPLQVGEGGKDVKESVVKVHENMKENDIVMVYTDGYSDNVFDKKFTVCLQKLIDPKTGLITNMSRAADCQARRAYISSKDRNYVSPWQKNAMKHNKHGADW